MNKYYLGSIIILGLGIVISGAIVGSALVQAQAQDDYGIQYPIAELGNCQNKEACKSYCDKPASLEACVAFAEKNSLMSVDEVQHAKNFIKAGAKGPGGCTGKEACEEYCNDISRIDECVAFAEQNNLMPPKELEEAKMVQAAIKRGVKPPPCGNKKACDNYCNEPENMEVCISFAQEAGFLKDKELEDSQKMIAAIKRGVKPPPCKGKEACDTYCQAPENIEACMNFAIEAGFMNEEEKEGAQKMMKAIKAGVKPLPCRGKEECDVYCGEDNHIEECMKFAEAAGFMTAEEAEMARKTGGKGPGNCRGKEECEAFCNNPDNQETCFNFAKEHGMLKEEDLKQMEQGKQQFQQALNSAPSEVIECLTAAFGVEQMEKFKAGTAMPSREIGDKMQECFSKSMGQGQGMMGPGGPEGGPDRTGPGGCKTPEECKAYCEANPQECQAQEQGGFGPPQSGFGPQGQENFQSGNFQGGPGGCKTPEECQAYCQANPQECQGFEQGQAMPMEGQMPPEGFQQPPPEGFQPPEGMMPPEGYQQPPQGFQPPEGTMMPPEGYQEQYQQQYQQQFQEQYQQQMIQQPTDQMMPPPPTESAPPPTEPAPAPSSFKPASLFGWMLKIFGF